jgi:hypothetical protein
MLKDLMAKRTDLEEQMRRAHEQHIAPLQEELNAVQVDIDHIIAPKLVNIRSLQQKQFGAVNITLDGFKVTSTVPKKVDWDQQKLLDVFNRILAAGDKPSEYMRMELKVPEKDYEAMRPEIQWMFADCRTVTPGKPTVKIEEVKNA